MEGTAAGGGSGTCGGGGGGGGGEGERLSDQQKLQVLRREFLKLREEHTQLQSQLAEFSKLKAKVRLLGLIQEDRRVLTEELVASNEKIAELVHENELLKESNNELSIENKKMKEQALKLNQYLDSAVDDLKQSTVRASRSLQAHENDQLYQKRFCLPDTEPLIASYSCFDSKMRGGKLYVSPNYLCFGTHFPRILGDGDTIIRLKDVRHIRKEKIFQLGKGGGKSLHFVLSDTEVVLFRGFVNRDKALDNILEQAKRFGATLLDN